METWKTSCGTLCHIVASGSSAAGQFTLDVLEICCVLSPECEEGHTWIHGLHHFVNHNSQHTKKHILGPLSSIGGIQVLRGRSPHRNGCFWVPGGLPP